VLLLRTNRERVTLKVFVHESGHPIEGAKDGLGHVKILLYWGDKNDHIVRI
jgi:hypothetical protein